MPIVATLHSELHVNTKGAVNAARPSEILDFLMNAGTEFAGRHDFVVPADGSTLFLPGIVQAETVQLMCLRNSGNAEFHVDMRNRHGVDSNVVRIQPGGVIMMFNILPKDNNVLTPDAMDFAHWIIVCKDGLASRCTFLFIKGT